MINRFDRTPIMHRIVKHGGTLYIGGVTADTRPNESMPMKEQAQRALNRLGELLQQAGSNKNRLLSITVYITDMSLKAAMNEAWIDWFDEDHLPTRATIGVDQLAPGKLIEIVAIASE